MIEEAYVSFETAKLLKDKGFQQIQDNCGYFTTDMVYSIAADKEGEHHFAKQYPAGVYNKDKYIAAPTQQMAMRWLREIHNIHIVINPYTYMVGHHFSFIFDKYAYDCWQELAIYITDSWDSYEKACEIAIKYCLEKLID